MFKCNCGLNSSGILRQTFKVKKHRATSQEKVQKLKEI